MNVQDYIDSGALESYILGAASEDEMQQLLFLKDRYPQIQNALFELERDMECIAQHMAIDPPPGTWDKIMAHINNEIIIPERPGSKDKDGDSSKAGSEFIEVEAESRYMRVHKAWKWVFAAVFILGKIFLICAIYFYLENRQAQQQINDLKTELKQHPVH